MYICKYICLCRCSCVRLISSKATVLAIVRWTMLPSMERELMCIYMYMYIYICLYVYVQIITTRICVCSIKEWNPVVSGELWKALYNLLFVFWMHGRCLTAVSNPD